LDFVAVFYVGFCLQLTYFQILPVDTPRYRYESTNMVGGSHWGGKEYAFGMSLG